MDEPVNTMTTLLSNVQTIISNFMSWFASVTGSLLTNDLVILMFGIGIALLIYKIALGLVSKASFRKSRRRR